MHALHRASTSPVRNVTKHRTSETPLWCSHQQLGFNHSSCNALTGRDRCSNLIGCKTSKLGSLNRGKLRCSGFDDNSEKALALAAKDEVLDQWATPHSSIQSNLSCIYCLYFLFAERDSFCQLSLNWIDWLYSVHFLHHQANPIVVLCEHCYELAMSGFCQEANCASHSDRFWIFSTKGSWITCSGILHSALSIEYGCLRFHRGAGHLLMGLFRIRCLCSLSLGIL